MYFVKDSPLELGFRVWQLRPPTPSLTVVVKGTFDPVEGEPASFADEPVPPTGEIYWEDDVEQSLRLPSDFPLLKPVGECFVIGKAWAPGGRAARAVACSFEIGRIKKSFGVFGDRQWRPGLVSQLTDPEPFESMELRMEHAYGGPGHAANPYGRGREKSDGILFAPNIEQVNSPVRSPGHKVDPVIVGPLPPSWPARMRYVGTYGQAYMDERWPWLPKDFDWRFFLEAPPEQRLREGFWRGDEPVLFEGLHPSLPRVRSRLPAITPRVFLHRAATASRPFEEVPLQLDTVTWDAEHGKLLLTWHGLVEVAAESLEDIEHLFVAHDPLAGPHRSVAELQARLDALLAEEENEERDAEGEEPPEPDADVAAESEEDEDDEAEDEGAEELEFAAYLQKQLAAAGIPTPEPSDEDTAPPDPNTLIERLRASGVPLPPEVESMLAEVAAEAEAEAARDPEKELEAEDEAAPLEGRALVEACLAAGEALRELDLTAADLSGMDLSRQDLTATILTRANLAGTKLVEANLSGCNVADAELTRAELTGAMLIEADFSRSNLRWVDLFGATLEDATFDEAEMFETRLTNAKAARATFIGANLAGSVLQGGDFSEADFERANLAGVNAAEAVLLDATLENASADGACFDRAVMTQARNAGLKATEARFGGIDAEDSFWERAELSRSDFSLSRLTRADFSDAVLIGAEMDGCLVRGGRFDRANAHSLKARKTDFLEASFESAELSFADLRGSNLFGAELWRTKTSNIQLELANIGRTKLEKR